MNGLTRPVAPSGLEAFEGLVRPICPHASNGFRENCEMHVRRKTHQFKVTWVFQAAHEGCDFIGEFSLSESAIFSECTSLSRNSRSPTQQELYSAGLRYVTESIIELVFC
jgi:hypothetical protein